MIAPIEAGLAAYLTAALATVQPTVVARPATSSDEVDRTRPLISVRVSTSFLPGSTTHALGNAEFQVMTPANVGTSNAAKQAEIEADLITALDKSSLATISTAVEAASGFRATGLCLEGFKDGQEKHFWSPYLSVIFSFVKTAD